MKQTNARKFTFAVSDRTKQRIVKTAKRLRITQSDLVRQAVMILVGSTGDADVRNQVRSGLRRA